MDDFSFIKNIDEQTKRRFANSINKGLGKDLDFVKINLELNTRNYRTGLCWDLIISNLMRDFDCEGVLFSIQKRGFFEFLIMLDKTSNILYTFMKEDRLKNVIKSKPGETPHYLNALTMLNKGLNAEVKQIQIFPVNKFNFDKKQLKAMLDSLCNDLVEKRVSLTCRHVIVTFSVQNKALSSMRANILNSNFDLIHSESWNEYITPSHESSVADEENAEPKENKDITIGFTYKAIERLGKQRKEDLQKLKEDKKKENIVDS